jgi:predicted XRE-type DNA-binding protein
MALRGLTQLDIATALGIGQTQVSARLRGEIDWRLSELRIITQLCRLDLRAILDAPSDYTGDNETQHATAVAS